MRPYYNIIIIDASQSSLVFGSTAYLSTPSLMHNILLIACSILIVVLTGGLRRLWRLVLYYRIYDIII